MSKYMAVVLAFAALMERQLEANDDKPGWQDESVFDLLQRMREETSELYHVLLSRRAGSDYYGNPITPERVGKEAADVANFALMIADRCGALDDAKRQATLMLAALEDSYAQVMGRHMERLRGPEGHSELDHIVGGGEHE